MLFDSVAHFTKAASVTRQLAPKTSRTQERRISFLWRHRHYGFWHDYNRSGTLTFKVKIAGLSRCYRSADPYKSHNAKRTWFVFVVIMQWVYMERKKECVLHMHR